MDKRNKAIEYFNYLVKTNPNKSVELKFYIRVYDDDRVEASCHPFILDKECIFCVAEYILLPGDGFKTKIDKVQLYFNNNGETFEYAPYNNGELRIDTRQACSGYRGRGYYDCSYSLNGLVLTYNGAPSIDYLPFYELFLSYAKMVEKCSCQSEVDYLKKCLEKDVKIEELNVQEIAKDAKMSRLKELVDSYKDLILEIKELVLKNQNMHNDESERILDK